MIKIILIAIFLALQLISHAQKDSLVSKEMWVGVGVGLDHGGIGIRVDGRVIPALSVIMGAGFNFAGVGRNVGLIYRVQPRSKICPYFTGFYGYNTAIRYAGPNGYVTGQNYNGPTFGAGLEIELPKGNSFFHFAMLYPIRSEEAEQAIRGARGINLPLLPSFGFHF